MLKIMIISILILYDTRLSVLEFYVHCLECTNVCKLLVLRQKSNIVYIKGSQQVILTFTMQHNFYKLSMHSSLFFYISDVISFMQFVKEIYKI